MEGRQSDKWQSWQQEQVHTFNCKYKALPAKLFTSGGLPRANVSRQRHQLDTRYSNAGDCGGHFLFKPQQIARVDEHKNADF